LILDQNVSTFVITKDLLYNLTLALIPLILFLQTN